MKRFLGAVSIACVVMLAAPSTRAAERADSWYLSPGVHGIWTDDLRNVDDDYGFNLAIGKAVSERWNLELDGWRSEHDGAGGDDLTLSSAGLNALAVFYRESRISPYLLLGAGWLEKNYDVSRNESDLYVDTGVGLLVNLKLSSDCSRGIALRADARARHDFADTLQGDDRLVDYMAGLGLHFFWGGAVCEREAPPLPEPPPPPPPPAPTDSDGDGVTDDKDRCPGTPTGAAVDASGCELDGDGDGVVDRLDKCPTTPRGDKVDAVGCSLTARLEVFFENNSDVLQAQSHADLDRAVTFLRDVPSATGVIEGHTDSNGSEAYNQELSERRARAVRDYILGEGIDPSRLTAQGLGETQPVADNTTAEGRAQNRRVVLRRTDQR